MEGQGCLTLKLHNCEIFAAIKTKLLSGHFTFYYQLVRERQNTATVQHLQCVCIPARSLDSASFMKSVVSRRLIMLTLVTHKLPEFKI